MKFWGFVVTASAVIIAALAVTAGASANINQDTSLKEQGSPIYNADSLTMFEEGDDFNDWNLNAERAKKKDCYEEGGSCILKKTAKNDCSGKLFKKYKCRAFKRICCIPDTTTNATIITPGGTIEECPPDYYYQNTTGQCFKPFITAGRMTWLQASIFCRRKGMELAHPQGAVELRQAMVYRHAMDDQEVEMWVNARYDGVRYNWQDDDATLSYNSALWFTGRPDEPKSLGCVLLLVSLERTAEEPIRPYFNMYCYWNKYPLCELKLA